MPDRIEEGFQGDQSIGESKPNAHTKARLVRAAENPGVAARERMGPKGSFPRIQEDIGSSHRHSGQFPTRNGMDRPESVFETNGVDAEFRPPSLKSGLRLRKARLDRLQPVAAREGAPRSNAEALENCVGIQQDGTAGARHAASEIDRGGHPVRREELCQILHGQIEQLACPPHREVTFLYGLPDRPQKALGEERGPFVSGCHPAVVP